MHVIMKKTKTYNAYFETYHNTFQVPSPCFNSLLNEKQAEPNETEALRSYGNALSMQICENYT